MPKAFVAHLADRGVVTVGGADAEKLLQGLITNDMGRLATARAMHAALLTPQGKIICDFLVVRAGGAFMLDVARDQAAALVKRLSMYKLRADVEIRDASEDYAVHALWGETPTSFVRDEYPDPRFPALGLRFFSPASAAEDDRSAASGDIASAGAYHAHRIGLGIPEGGKDFPFGDTFPHEADMDLLDGIDFKKGCYVGQEIVSRMQHRGTARKRVVPVAASGPLPAPGTDVTTGAATIGKLGSVAGDQGLALLRLDRVEEAAAKNEPLLAGGVPIRLRQQSWLPFKLPGAS